MKTWIFSEDTLEREVEQWVEVQVRTGGPVAERNAGFVGLAIKDFLLSSDKLLKETIGPSAVGITRTTTVVTQVEDQPHDQDPSKQKQEESPGTDSMSIVEMLKEWNATV